MAKQILSLSSLISFAVSCYIAIIAFTIKIPKEGKIAAWIRVANKPKTTSFFGSEKGQILKKIYPLTF